MPDVELTAGRLYNLVDTSALTLLVSGSMDGLSAAVAPWADLVAVREVSLPQELVPAAGWLLVRPDGHLAAAGRAGDAHRLHAWLARWMILQ